MFTILKVNHNKKQQPETQEEAKKKSEIKRKRLKVRRSLQVLLVLTPVFAMSALISFTISLATSDWLRTEEKMPNYNRTVLFGPNKSPEYLPKQTHSGLFEICFTKRK